MTYLFLILFLYIMYRFIVGFVIPVSRATKTMRQQFADVKQRMEQEQQPSGASHPTEKPRYDVEGEYIPFEEVK